VYKPGQIRLSARQTIEPNIAGTDRSGYVVSGDTLYWSFYSVDGTGEIDPAGPPALQHKVRLRLRGWSHQRLLDGDQGHRQARDRIG
jgi:hypothetical protein